MAQPQIDQLLQQALAHQQAGRLREAESLCRQALSIEPDRVDALHLLSVIALAVGQFAAGLELIDRAIALDRSSPNFFATRGQALAGLGRLDEAVTAYQRAIDLHAGFPEAHINLAGILYRQGKIEPALEQCRAALKLRPGWWLAQYNIGLLLAVSGRPGEAAVELERAAALEPNHAQTWHDLGGALRGAGRWEESIRASRRAIKLQPDLANAYVNLGIALQELGRTAESLELLQRAIQLRPDSSDGHNGLGSALHELGQYDRAAAHFQQALTLRPDWSVPAYNLAFELLLKGDFAHGWKAYESRLHGVDASRSRLTVNAPRWTGDDLNGRMILLHTEQGFGDAIMFARFIPLVHARGGRVMLMCQPALIRLLKTVNGVEQVTSVTDPPPRFDVHCPLMSLPFMFGTSVQTIPASVPYLRTDPDLETRWRVRTLEQLSGLRVGLCWGWVGRPSLRNRAIDPSLLEPLLKIPGVSLTSLQVDGPANQIPGLTDWTSELKDFADTAALVQNLDLVITIDTAVAHLAGALGKPAWVLVPFVPDWKWMLDREDSPWYPTMKLIRQPVRGEWRDSIQRVVEMLAKLKDSR